MRFLTTVGISYAIDQVIISARKFIIIISPFFNISKIYVQNLQSSAKAGVAIDFVYGKKELNKTNETEIRKIDNVKMPYLENLHAKCYLNESNAIITSMNM